MRFFIFVLALVTAIAVTTPARAEDDSFSAGCYTADEMEAEQGLRIHTELMIIGLNCQHLAARNGNGNLYRQYEDFTRRNTRLIAGYERTMVNYYRRAGSNNTERDINDLRTLLANKISGEVVRLQPNVFCKAYGGRITQALGMNEPQLRQWASTVFPGFEPTRPSCAALTRR